MPKNEENKHRDPNPPRPGTKNDMTHEEFYAVLSADREDSGEESKTAFDLIDEYGTYEIQRTADTSNVFPAIAQGLGKKWQFDEPKNGKEPGKGK